MLDQFKIFLIVKSAEFEDGIAGTITNIWRNISRIVLQSSGRTGSGYAHVVGSVALILKKWWDAQLQFIDQIGVAVFIFKRIRILRINAVGIQGGLNSEIAAYGQVWGYSRQIGGAMVFLAKRCVSGRWFSREYIQDTGLSFSHVASVLVVGQFGRKGGFGPLRDLGRRYGCPDDKNHGVPGTQAAVQTSAKQCTQIELPEKVAVKIMEIVVRF